jgi:LysM repeat protein
MKFLRWFLIFFLLLLILSARTVQNQAAHSRDPAQPQREATSLEGRDYVYYTVQAGDTLAMLTRKFRVPSEDSILQINPDLKGDRLPVNKRIKIPLQ